MEAVRQDFTHVKNWDEGGKQWVKGMAAKGDLVGLVHGLCHHYKRGGKRGEFKDLSEDDIGAVAKGVLADDFLAKTITAALKVKVPRQ